MGSAIRDALVRYKYRFEWNVPLRPASTKSRRAERSEDLIDPEQERRMSWRCAGLNMSGPAADVGSKELTQSAKEFSRSAREEAMSDQKFEQCEASVGCNGSRGEFEGGCKEDRASRCDWERDVITPGDVSLLMAL